VIGHAEAKKLVEEIGEEFFEESYSKNQGPIFWIGFNERGYALCGKSWTLPYHQLLTLLSRTELANCSETRKAYEPMLCILIL